MRTPRLEAWTLDGRPVIIFSADDLTAGLVGYPRWGLKGYDPETAFELMRNILLFASGQKIPASKSTVPEAGGRNW